jgi:hypothetical protein
MIRTPLGPPLALRIGKIANPQPKPLFNPYPIRCFEMAKAHFFKQNGEWPHQQSCDRCVVTPITSITALQLFVIRQTYLRIFT